MSTVPRSRAGGPAPPAPEPEPEIAGQLRINGHPLFPPIRLKIAAGTWTALLGPSGVGKSTLLRLIAGLPVGADFSGQICNPQPMALMAQDPGLLPWLTAQQNAALGARLRGEAPDLRRLGAILEQTGLAGHAMKFPAQLSGGQRQRVALARTLMEDRALVLLDEPFSALDMAMRLAMQDLAAGLLAGRSVLMVTHDPAEAARLCDHIFLLSETGLCRAPAPESAAPRPPAASDVLACQAALLSQLISGVAG